MQARVKQRGEKMNFTNVIKNRRTVYALNKELPVFIDRIIQLINDSVRYVPDAFNMQSQRVVVVMGDKNKQFWDGVYDAVAAVSGGKFSRDRTESFSAGAGTILYFYDAKVVNKAQKKYPLYAKHFHDWVMQSNGMLQYAIWTGLRTLGIGANLQHYNPIIDDMTRKMFDLPKTWVLVAQMPFGNIAALPPEKPAEDISLRVKIER